MDQKTKTNMTELWDGSAFYGESSAWLESMYETYLSNPDLLDEKWRQYFDALSSSGDSHSPAAQSSEVSPKEMHDYL